MIKIWQDPNFLKSNVHGNTIGAKNVIESTVVDTTVLGSHATNFPSENNIENKNNFIRESFKDITMNINQHNNIQSFNEPLEALELQIEESNKTISRKYSFCYGHIPYTAIFIIFEPDSQEQGATNKTYEAAPESAATEVDPRFQDSRRARTILDDIARKAQRSAQKSPEQGHGLQNNTYNCMVPEIGFPWKPKKRLVIQQQQDRNFTQQDLDKVYVHNTSVISNKSPPSLRQPKITGVNGDKDKNQSGVDQDEDQYLTPNNFQDDVRNITDKEVDRVQEFNDRILQSNGFQIFSFMKTNMDPQIYARAMITKLDQGIFMYICKPCDMAGFDQTNFLIHLTTPKHKNNTKSWIQQHYILQEPQFNSNDKEPIIMKYKNSLQGSTS